MSVYIKLLYGELLNEPSNKIYAMISSSCSLLTTSQKPKSKKPQWNCLIISSNKEQQLVFHIYENNKQQQKLVGSAYLNCLITNSQPMNLFEYNIPLKSKTQQVGTLYLSIYYNDKKKYIGDVQFYKNNPDLYLDNGNFDKNTLTKTKTESTLNAQSPYMLNSKKLANAEHNYQIQNQNIEHVPKNKEQIKFYKGPCRTKNLFSLLDSKVEDESFHIIQPKYN